jgi:ribosomal protein S18 acetylase RimI-like enzyme
VKNDNRWVLGAFSGQALVGVVGFGREDSEKTRHRGHIWGMHVDAAWRRKGIGRALLAAVLSRTDAIPGLASVRLGVTSTNLGALSLYRSFGFGSLYTEDEYLFADGSYHSMHFMRRWSDASRRVTGDRAKDLPVA